tara:strand:+ start:1599 stop:1757 length:159 start_codon:yes stop_codon:yes gene_type:complete
MTLDEHLQIEEILAEANAFGLKQEVIHTAAKLAAAGYSSLDAHALAFSEWCK